MVDDLFQEVKESDIPKVLENLKINWPQHFILHQYITLIANNRTNKSPIFQMLYCYGSFERGVYLIQSTFSVHPDQLSLFFVYTASDDLTSLHTVLTETKRIPWHSRGYMFEVTMSRFSPVIGQVIASKGLQAFVQHYRLLWLPPDIKVDSGKLPDDMYLGSLDERHVEEVARNWPEFPGSERFTALEIMTSGGRGIFRKHDKKLLSSILCFHSGGIFMLYTEPEYRRRGLGEIVIRSIIRENRQKNILPFCTVFPDNIPSLNLVRKIGFKDFGKADYIIPSQFLQSI